MTRLNFLVVIFGVFIWNFLSFAEEPQHHEINLLVNGSFEDGKTGWTENEELVASKITVGTIDSSTSTDGKNSLKLDNTINESLLNLYCNAPLCPSGGGPTCPHLYVSQNCNLKASTRYIVKLDIKRTITQGDDPMCVAVLECDEESRDWEHHWCGNFTWVTKGINTWEHFELIFKTKPKITFSAIILYNLVRGGIAWYDNVQLMEVKE